MSRLAVPTASPREERLRHIRATLYDEETPIPTAHSSNELDAAFTDELKARVRDDRDAVVLVWGEAGSGKSTFVLDRARKVDDTFTPATLPQRVAFRAHQVPAVYRATPKFGVAWIDEAASAGLLSTESPFSVRQRSLVELVNIIRADNKILFVVIPSPDDLAKSFRARRADYRVETYIDDAGESGHAWLGRRVRGRHFLLADSRWLGFSDDERGVPLTWPEYRGSSDPVARALWDVYWPLKRAHMDDRSFGIEAELKGQDGQDE